MTGTPAIPEHEIGIGNTLYLDATSSTDGSNPHTHIPYHDGNDSIVSYEWDLHGTSDYVCTCGDPPSTGIDLTGSSLDLTDSDLADLRIDVPGAKTFCLRVTDEVGVSDCQTFAVLFVDGQDPEVTVDTPNGGESWDYSPDPSDRRQHHISWDAVDNGPITRTKVSYSPTGSVPWICIADSDYDNYYSSTTPVSIPDNFPMGVFDSISVPDSFTVGDVNVKVTIGHPAVEQLDIILHGPGGSMYLCDTSAVSGSNFTGTIFDDEAWTDITAGSAPFTGYYSPVDGLNVFDGQDAQTTWTLQVIDNISGETGSIESWSINFSDCNNSNVTDSDTLLPSGHNFWWEMPTEEEAAHTGATLPTSTAKVRVQVWDESSNSDTDNSDNNFYIIQPTTTNIKTLIFWDSDRIEDTYSGQSAALSLKLQELSDHAKISGEVRDLAGAVDPVSGEDLSCFYDCWDSGSIRCRF